MMENALVMDVVLIMVHLLIVRVTSEENQATLSSSASFEFVIKRSMLDVSISNVLSSPLHNTWVESEVDISRGTTIIASGGLALIRIFVFVMIRKCRTMTGYLKSILLQTTFFFRTLLVKVSNLHLLYGIYQASLKNLMDWSQEDHLQFYRLWGDSPFLLLETLLFFYGIAIVRSRTCR